MYEQVKKTFDALRAWSAAIRTQQWESVLAQDSESAPPLLETAVKLTGFLQVLSSLLG
jgi:hypothetical protein